MRLSEATQEQIGNRLRKERVELFSRLIRGEKALRGMLALYVAKLTAQVEKNAGDPGRVRHVYNLFHTETVYLRASMRVWFNALIKDASRMGFKHAGEAVKPIFESVQFERKLLVERELEEARYTRNAQKIFKDITKRNMKGLNPSDKIWDLTNRTEQDLKRIVANGIGAGDNPAVIARRIKKYISPGKASELGVQTGPGVYRSAYSNAMRLARTEMNKTYAKATAQFAKGKPWVKGITITLSPQHAGDDECDEYAGETVSPADFAKLVPFHPHCMCLGVYEIDPKYLGEEE